MQCCRQPTRGDTTLNLATIIDRHEPNRTALIDGERIVTFGELRTQSTAIRAVLHVIGIQPDDRVVIVSGNEPQFVPCLLGALGLGARIIPVSHMTPLPELDRKLAAVDPAAVLVCEDAGWLLEHQQQFAAPILDVNTLDLTNIDGAPEVMERDPDDVAIMMLTSGISGDAKIAMLTHRNLEWAQTALSGDSNNGMLESDVVLASLPFGHIFGLNAVLLTALRVGATSIIQRRFDVDASVELIAEHKITVLAGAPPMWRRWSGLADATESFASVRIAVSGAAALRDDVFDAMQQVHGVTVEQGYGLTETAAAVTNNRGVEVRKGSVGKPIGDIEMMLVEDDGTPVDPGDSGEIVVRGPNIFAGYFGSVDKTEEALSANGWFWTGDVGVIDDDGYVFIVDRVKDIIIVSGFNVYPAEVEQILLTHPDVTGAIVVGEPHDLTDETVVAYVTGAVEPEVLITFAHDQLTRYKCPTSIYVVDELPIAATGKLIRRELRS